MLEQINALPCSQLQAPIRHWNGQVCRQHCCLDMRGHIIWALICVREIGHRWVCRGWDKSREVVLQVDLNLWICVFLDQKACGCVLDHKCQQTGALHPPCDITRKFV